MNFLDKLWSRFLSTNILIPVIANEMSTKETTTKDSNKINVKAMTKVLHENRLFSECDDNLHKTGRLHKQVNAKNDNGTYKGSIGISIGFSIETRDAANQIGAHKPDIGKKYRFINSLHVFCYL